MRRRYVPSMEKYTVAILCALDKELFAVRALFDERHPVLPNPRGCADSNHYALGRIGHHNVVSSGLPSGEYGTNAASDVVSNLKRTFPSVEFCLLVGIGGGVPEANDVRLGDVVVSHPSGTVPGVVQYDLGKTLEVQSFIRTGVLRGPPRQLMTAITALKSDPDLPDNPLAKSLDQVAGRKPAYSHPSQQRGTEMDILYSPGYAHPSAAKTCNRCDKSQIVHRKSRSSTHPIIHYGPIASGNQVMKSAKYRDQLSKEYDIYCFEMEAAGVMNSIECLVIRGICDYADSHKNDIWHEYACATAAAYAKLLLSYCKPYNPAIVSLATRAAGNARKEGIVCLSAPSNPVCDSTGKSDTEEPRNDTTSGINQSIDWIKPSKGHEERFLECKSFARRRPSWDNWPSNANILFNTLQRWISNPKSCLLTLEARPVDSKRARDISLEIIDFIRLNSQFHVIYTLSSPTGENDTTVDILKNLVTQAISILPDLQSLIPQQSTDDENQLLDLTNNILRQSKNCFIILETTNTNCADQLLRICLDIIQDRSIPVKFMLVTYQRSQLEGKSKGIVESVNLPPSQPRNGRTVGKRQVLWRRLKPQILDSQASGKRRIS